MSDPVGAVAVIGMAGRFPGAADVERFWENLRAGKETITFFTPGELDPAIPAAVRDDPAYVKARGVIGGVEQFDADGLQALLVDRPEHACGGGPMVAVMRAAWDLGAREARLLKYADSGDVSGDKHAVVGYLAAAFGSLS